MKLLFILDNSSFDMLRLLNLFKSKENVSIDIQNLLRKIEISNLQAYIEKKVEEKKITHIVIQTLLNFNWEILIKLKKKISD